MGLATWHWRQKESPFEFEKGALPVFLVHATNDGLQGGAPIELLREIKADLEALGVPVKMVEFGFPPAKWPDLLLEWLASLKQERQG